MHSNKELSPVQNNRSCNKCTRLDSDENMVCCDKCETWEHYSCAGVNESIAKSDRSWKCEVCRDTNVSKSETSFSGASASSRRSQRLQLSLELLDKQKELRLKALAEEEEYLKQKYELLKQLEEDGASRKSEVSARSKRERLQKWLENGAKTCENDKRIGEPSSKHPAASVQIRSTQQVSTATVTGTQSVPKSSIVVSHNESISKPSETFSVTKTVPQPVVHSQIQSQAAVAVPISSDYIQQNFAALSICTAPPVNTHVVEPSTSAQAQDAFKYTGAIPKSTSRAAISFDQPIQPQLDMTNQAASQYLERNVLQQGPTPAQLAARQVMPRDLPKFSGDPQEWPIFYSSFKNTTEVCGYSDAENLARLQRSLTGHALEAVRSRLLLPASVPHVMETLRRLYGRPEILVNSLLKQIRNVTPPKPDNLKTIVTYGLAVQNLVEHLTIADQQAHLCNPMLLQELVDKLPTTLKLQWGGYKQQSMNVNLETFNQFMTGLVNIASDLTIDIGVINCEAKTTKYEKRNPRENLFVHANSSCEVDNKEVAETNLVYKCSFCDDSDHMVRDCKSFRALDIDKRWKAVRQKGLCRTCLIPHRRWPCRSTKECGIDGCRIRHHMLLHSTREAISNTLTHQAPCQTCNKPVEHQHHHWMTSYSLFRYLPVTISGNGTQASIFAFLDDGSSSTLLEADVAAQLGIVGQADTMWLSWTGKISREERDSERINLSIRGVESKSSFSISNVRTVKQLGLPAQSLDYAALAKVYPHLRGLPVASYQNAVPKMIIGLEHVRLLTSLKVREGGVNDPVAAKTRLGWCVYGRKSGVTNVEEHINVHADCEKYNRELHETIKQFFLVEEVHNAHKQESNADKRAVEILERTTIRKGNRFETGLLWKADQHKLPNSYPMALKRLVSLEKRLSREPELLERVNKQIESYLDKKYAHKASRDELASSDPQHVWYLPLGIVTNPKKPEKVRLVWDAAASAGGVCFNDLMLKGPDLLTSLPAILFRFRQRKIAVCGDIREMFHQIMIRNEDKQYQRFLWRDSSTNEVQVYVMDVATFGATCSPCSAQFVKNKNALEYIDSHSRAVHAIIENHYVDDFLDSVDTIEEAVTLIREVMYVHSAGGFDITGFSCNSPEVLQSIGGVEPVQCKTLELKNEDGIKRVLGMVWFPSADIFTFDLTSRADIICLLNNRVVPTKRQVLRVVMMLFDPLGLIAHFIVHGKILMQEIWRTGINWDDTISENLHDSWFRWAELLSRLGEIQIPRCYFSGITHYGGIQLHTFVDASETAYACVSYIRIFHQNEVQL